MKIRMSMAIGAIALLSMAFLSGCKHKDWMDWVDWKIQNEHWLEENMLRDSIVVTASGLQYKILSKGNVTDARPSTSSSVYVDYEGKLITGNTFDKATASLDLSNTVDGFAEGLKHIYSQGDIELYIPWELGYGAQGSGTEGYTSFVPPFSTLIIRVHLKGIIN